MILIACVDNKNGMMFNKRRQSRDRVLIERIKSITAGKKLWMNSYSAPLFGDGVCVDEDFQNKAAEGEFCFTENEKPLEAKAEKIILYKWNRDYPADMYFDIDLSGWRLAASADFKGYSHDRITEEIYVK
ncbi:MAG: ribonuclease Z [Candidatus Ornithomonoglobus sp.]